MNCTVVICVRDGTRLLSQKTVEHAISSLGLGISLFYLIGP